MEVILPHDLISLIFILLSSKERPNICSVSKLFEKLAIKSSRFSKAIDNEEDAKLSLLSGNYHWFVYSKYLYFDLSLACHGGNLDVVNLMIISR